MKQHLGLSGLVILASLVGGCTLTSNVGTPTTGASSQPSNKNPIIQSLTSNPSAAGNWSQVFTFNVTAYSPGGDVLSYSWSTTGGTLSSTTGQVTSWTPPKVPGTYTVQISVSDPTTGGQAVGATNLTIGATGDISVR